MRTASFTDSYPFSAQTLALSITLTLTEWKPYGLVETFFALFWEHSHFVTKKKQGYKNKCLLPNYFKPCLSIFHKR